jgi:glycine/D-amino acid oxidase-like deaminating enzyme
VRPSYDKVPRVHQSLRRELTDLFPALGDAAFTHAWGGPLGVPRDWFPSVGFDRATGMAWAGGYVGDGVSTSNLAGRTLADLILGRDSELPRLAWVGHRSPKWEPEPWRWLGARTMLWATTLADRHEQRHGKPSRLAHHVERLVGH